MSKKFLKCQSVNEASASAPWAQMIVAVAGGFMAFRSLSDYLDWNGEI